MIEAVSRIGDYVQRTKGIQDLISIFIENPNSKGKCNFVLTIIDFSFRDLMIQEIIIPMIEQTRLCF